MNKPDKRVVVITGGASGIGAAIAKGFLQDSGLNDSWQVLIADRNKELGEAFAQSIGADFKQVDLSQSQDCHSLVDEVIERYQRLDVLVNNAGIQNISPIEDFPEDKWNTMLSIMLTAPFLLTKHAWPQMKKQQWGRIVNMASIHSLVASANKSAYITAKHGLIGLTKASALEGGEFGITVNAVSPAYVRTPLVENQIADQARVNNISEDEVIETIMLKNSAVKRLIEPEEVAKAVLLLCSEQGASITGSNLTLDGGWTAQ